MKIGSLFTGYGGLDLAVEATTGASLAWYAEIEPAACKVLGNHFPGIPNLRDVKSVDWSTVEPIDILTGGYPCQPFSHAGLRKGTEDERHLWPYVKQAIEHLHPRLVILENVRGHLSLGFNTVLEDLADIGYDAEWSVVHASDVGAPHKRARLFILAYPHGERLEGHFRRPSEASTAGSGHPFESLRGLAAYSHSRGHGEQQDPRGMGSVEAGHEEQARQREWPWSQPDAGGDWGRYGLAIDLWESLTHIPAPAPTVIGKHGKPRLNPEVPEWMMGLPVGWVTGHGLTQAQATKMLGNGVCPPQAVHAIRGLLTRAMED